MNPQTPQDQAAAIQGWITTAGVGFGAFTMTTLATYILASALKRRRR